jgi:hypothetical protein
MQSLADRSFPRLFYVLCSLSLFVRLRNAQIKEALAGGASDQRGHARTDNDREFVLSRKYQTCKLE